MDSAQPKPNSLQRRQNHEFDDQGGRLNATILGHNVVQEADNQLDGNIEDCGGIQWVEHELENRPCTDKPLGLRLLSSATLVDMERHELGELEGKSLVIVVVVVLARCDYMSRHWNVSSAPWPLDRSHLRCGRYLCFLKVHKRVCKA